MSESSAPKPVAAGGRRVHWIELFFDLVMVAYIGQVAHGMHGEVDWLDALVFFALFAPAWWAWVNVTITLNLFGARMTPTIWAAITVVMISIGVMAAAVPEALGERAWAFAIGNAVIRVIWMTPWLLKQRSIGVPWWRPIAYSGLPAALWLVSAFLHGPVQYLLWAIAIAVEVVLLGFLGGQTAWLQRSLDVDHIVERVTLVVVIVFGESVLSVIGQLSEHWTLISGITAIIAFLAVALLAWVFFHYAAGAAENGWRRLRSAGRIGALRDTVMYLPFLLIAGIALFAAGLGTAVADAGHPLPMGSAVCVAGGIVLFHVSSAAESLRYGAPIRDVVTWGTAGLLVPWSIVVVALFADAEYVVVTACIVILIMLGLAEANVRRIRRTGGGTRTHTSLDKAF